MDVNQSAQLAGKDELGFGAAVDGFLPAPVDGPQQVFLKGLLRANSPYQLDRGYVRLTPEDTITAVWHDPTDTIALIWATEDHTADEPQTFTNDEDETITFWPKVVTYYKPLGKGEAFVAEAQQQVADLRTAVDMVAARTLDGFGAAPDPFEEVPEPPAGFGA